jgi:hypothetical protein
MDLSRRNLLVEYGPYGPSLRGLSVSLGKQRTNAPFGLDPAKEKERLESSLRRRARLRQLAIEWIIANGGKPPAGSSGRAFGRPQ